MRHAEKIALISVTTVILVIVYVILITLLMYEEPAQYIAPCRTVGHLQIPESECGR